MYTKTFRPVFSLLFCCVATFAQIKNVQVTGTTSTQAVISYTAPSQAACTVAVSESSNYSPLVNAVNPALFAGSNSDAGGSVNRTFVAGRPTTALGSDNRRYSQALRAATPHFYRISCGQSLASGTFTTGNIPLGNTRSDALPVDPKAPGSYLWPDDPPNGKVVDPETGVLLTRLIKKNAWLVRGNGYSPNGYPFSGTNPKPAGANWSNPTGILADDSSYAAYSGTAQSWLFLPTGGTFPAGDGDGNGFAELSYQNLVLKGYCSGPDCTTGGGLLQIAVTTDGSHPLRPLIDVPLGLTETTITVCSDAPCSHPETPGDTMTYDALKRDSRAPSTGRAVYDTSNPLKPILTDVADCNRMAVGTTLGFGGTGASVSAETAVVTGRTCASPPRVFLDHAVSTLASGPSTGMPFTYSNGIRRNGNYGFLVRKKSTTANSTIYLNYASYKMMGYASNPYGASATSAGNHKICSNLPSANGYYHCAVGQEIYGIKPAPDGSADVRFLGVAYYKGGGTIVNGAMLPCVASNGSGDWLWDDNDPNTFYCNGQSSQINPANGKYDQRAVLVKIHYTGNDVECGPNGPCPASNPYGSETDRAPMLPQDRPVNLTPCLNSCTNPSDDTSFIAQISRFTEKSSYVFAPSSFGSCGVDAIQSNYAIINCRQGQQDSFAWMSVMDLNSNKVIAANPTFARFNGSWATNHTYDTNGPVPVAQFGVQSDKDQNFKVQLSSPIGSCIRGSTCDPCPNVTLQQNGFNYKGKQLCSTINVTSSWNSAWGSPPPDFAPGEFVSALPNLHFLQTTEAGDAFQIKNPGEYIRLVQKVSPSQWVVERGAASDGVTCSQGGFQGGYNGPASHANGETITTLFAFSCDPQEGYDMAWYFLDSPDGSDPDSYFYSQVSNHATSRGNVRVAPFYKGSLADPVANKADYRKQSVLSDPSVLHVGVPNSFNGAYQFAQPNAIENHPSYGQVNAEPEDQGWFIDLNPLLFYSNTLSGQAITPITGSLYRYNAAYHDVFDETFKLKTYDVGAFCGDTPLLNVSGPGVVLSGSLADAYKVCAVTVAGECAPNSKPGEVYMNCPTVWSGLPYCKPVESYCGFRDICAGNYAANANGYTQWGLPLNGAAPNFASGRVFARLFNRYRQGATVNAKVTPDGKFALLNNEFVASLPPFPSADGIDRTSFIPMQIPLPAVTNATNAYIEFGYDAQFRCTKRNERCITAPPSGDPTGDPTSGGGGGGGDPFYYPSEYGSEALTPGSPCSGGCTLTVPAISNRVLYYHAVFRNANNQRVAVSATQAVAIP